MGAYSVLAGTASCGVTGKYVYGEAGVGWIGWGQVESKTWRVASVRVEWPSVSIRPGWSADRRSPKQHVNTIPRPAHKTHCSPYAFIIHLVTYSLIIQPTAPLISVPHALALLRTAPGSINPALLAQANNLTNTLSNPSRRSISPRGQSKDQPLPHPKTGFSDAGLLTSRLSPCPSSAHLVLPPHISPPQQRHLKPHIMVLAQPPRQPIL